MYIPLHVGYIKSLNSLTNTKTLQILVHVS